MALYKKGEGGRPAGVKNKVTTIQRNYIQELLDGEQDKLKVELNKLDGKDYINVITDLMEFCIPKLQRTELTGNIEVKSIVGMIIK